MCINTATLSIFLIFAGIIKIVLPIQSLKLLLTRFIIKVGELWIDINNLWIQFILKPRWTVEGFEEMDKRSWYLSLSNHQSWADIFIVQMITNRKVPMLKFFMKFVLIYVPVIGICWWALDMPFLKRYSKDQLERNPSLRGKDFASMKRSFKKYRLYPISVFSFTEGTRFT